MKILKWLKNEKIAPLHMLAGDTLSVDYTDPTGKKNTLIQANIEKAMIVDEVRIFEGKVGEKDALGGVLIGKKSKPNAGV